MGRTGIDEINFYLKFSIKFERDHKHEQACRCFFHAKSNKAIFSFNFAQSISIMLTEIVGWMKNIFPLLCFIFYNDIFVYFYQFAYFGLAHNLLGLKKFSFWMSWSSLWGWWKWKLIYSQYLRKKLGICYHGLKFLEFRWNFLKWLLWRLVQFMQIHKINLHFHQ